MEVHSANGYLLDEFLRDGSNKRTGNYGGTMENRARFLFEVLEVVCHVWGSDRVGLRISPLNSFNSMIDSDPMALSGWLARELNSFELAYLHVMRADFFEQQKGDVLTNIRTNYKGLIISNMGYDAEEADDGIAQDKFDAVAFGTKFLANPDLPARFKVAAELNEADPDTFYSSGAAGYTDYPNLNVGL